MPFQYFKRWTRNGISAKNMTVVIRAAAAWNMTVGIRALAAWNTTVGIRAVAAWNTTVGIRAQNRKALMICSFQEKGNILCTFLHLLSIVLLPCAYLCSFCPVDFFDFKLFLGAWWWGRRATVAEKSLFFKRTETDLCLFKPDFD